MAAGQTTISFGRGQFEIVSPISFFFVTCLSKKFQSPTLTNLGKTNLFAIARPLFTMRSLYPREKTIEKANLRIGFFIYFFVHILRLTVPENTKLALGVCHPYDAASYMSFLVKFAPPFQRTIFPSQSN